MKIQTNFILKLLIKKFFFDNSILIKTEKAVPIIPAKTAKIKYKVPISLAFVENNQRVIIIILNNLLK